MANVVNRRYTNGVRYGLINYVMDYDDFYNDYTRENETLEYKEDGTLIS